MKPGSQKLTLGLALTLLMARFAASGQSTIIYSSGPSFLVPSYYDPGSAFIDFDQDGVPDLSFAYYLFICTADFPASGCSVGFEVSPLGTNATLDRSCQVLVLPFGAEIGGVTPANAVWGARCEGVDIARYFFSPRYGTRGYGGPLADVGVGYLGAQFSAADGVHYGWVRVRMPRGAEFGPVVVDWAYEARPDTLILAGKIDSSAEARQFGVSLENAAKTGTAGTGTLILAGDRLRCELILSGSYASAAIAGPAPVQANARPRINLGQPLVVRTNHSAFFAEAAVSRSDEIQLLRGAASVSIDDGAVVGRIIPLE